MFDASSTDSKISRSVEGLKARYLSLLSNAPLSPADPRADAGAASKTVCDPAASPAPLTGGRSKGEPVSTEAVAPASDAASQRRLFDLRKALKSAVRVLTKELSFTSSAPTLCETESKTETGRHAEPEVEPSAELRPAGLSGHTSAVAIPELLGFLAQLRKSGTLWIWNDRQQFRVQLVDGNVTFARNEAPHQGSLLGEILIAQGAIDAARFEEFLKQPRESGPLGDALLKAGLVDKQALSNAVQSQAQSVFHRAYGLEDAHFCFDANRGYDTHQGIQISVTQMLFESARQRDESKQRLASVFNDPSGKK